MKLGLTATKILPTKCIVLIHTHKMKLLCRILILYLLLNLGLASQVVLVRQCDTKLQSTLNVLCSQLRDLKMDIYRHKELHIERCIIRSINDLDRHPLEEISTELIFQYVRRMFFDEQFIKNARYIAILRRNNVRSKQAVFRLVDMFIVNYKSRIESVLIGIRQSSQQPLKPDMEIFLLKLILGLAKAAFQVLDDGMISCDAYMALRTQQMIFKRRIRLFEKWVIKSTCTTSSFPCNVCQY